jgi:hypothetical protein
VNQEAAVVPRWTEWPFRELEVDQEGYPLNLAALSQEEREDFLAGYWVEQPDQWKDRITAPVGPTHDFDRTYGYDYCDEGLWQSDPYYYEFGGVWRFNGSLIEVKLMNRLVSDLAKEEGPDGSLQFPPEKKITHIPIPDAEWQTLGSLESVRLGLVNDTNGTLEVEPARISLRYFHNGRLSEETKFYWTWVIKGLRYGDLERYCGPVSTRRRQPQTP